jgi:hypothetical protein
MICGFQLDMDRCGGGSIAVFVDNPNLSEINSQKGK